MYLYSLVKGRAQHGSTTGDVNEKKPAAPSGNVFTKKSPDWSKKKQNGSKNTSPNENGNTNGNDNKGLKGTASVKQLDKDIVEKERHEAEDELTAMKLEVETLGEPVVERVTEPAVESVVEKVTEAGERVVEPVMKPTVKQVVEPVGEPVVDVMVEPVGDPVVDVMVEPVGDPVVDVMVEPVMKKALTKADIQPEETGVNATKNVPKRITSATEIFFAERSTSLVVPDFSSRRYSDGATRTRKRGIVLDQPPMLPPGALNPQTFVPSSSSVNQMEKVAEQGIQKGFSPDESRPEDGRSGSEKESEDDDKVEENAKRAVRRAVSYPSTKYFISSYLCLKQYMYVHVPDSANNIYKQVSLIMIRIHTLVLPTNCVYVCVHVCWECVDQIELFVKSLNRKL